MSEIKVKSYRIVGEVRKPLFKIPFKKNVRALSQEDAMEKILSEIGSRHKAKRFEVKIITAEEQQEK